MKLIYEVVSTVGRVRRENQDNVYLNGKIKRMSHAEFQMSGTSEDSCQVFAVCDGMGGEDSGEVASSMAVRILQNYVLKKREMDWGEYIKEANQKICAYQKQYEVSMGTTFTGICFNPFEITAVNVGDSRIYRIHQGQITQLSRDHSEYQTMVDEGVRADERTMRRAKCCLTQFLGLPEDELLLEPHAVKIKDQVPGDYYLLCSDGLWGTLSDEQMLAIIQAHRMEEENICEFLIKAAEEQGSKDNITAMLIYVFRTDEKIQTIETCSMNRINGYESDFKTNDVPETAAGEKKSFGIKKILNFFRNWI